ncbi:MAG: hypothetical protein INQ03_06735 [Candidatus Heimdallarchaeota archaeon]|nr:hypothetical protein [Candidatus Heimdallarchaeota archaeon]
MGLRDIDRKIRINSAFQRQEAEMLLQELDQMIENVEILKEQLKKFEKTHKNEIKGNKEYYEKIAEIRDSLGLPDEVGIYEWKDAPTLTDRLSKSGYYDQLAHEILEYGKLAVVETGGMISVAELVLKINKSRPGKLVPPRDVIKSLKLLIDDDLLPPLRKLASGVIIAEFVAIELSKDQEAVFSLASRHGFLTQESLIVQLGWPAERAIRILEELVKQGIALKDESYHEGTKYWFPSLGQ